MMEEILRYTLEKSKQSKVSWEPFTETSYIATVGDISVVIEKNGAIGFGTTAYALRVVNENGKEIGRLSPSSPDAVLRDLKELHDLARRKALKIDESMDELLKNLKNL